MLMVFTCPADMIVILTFFFYLSFSGMLLVLLKVYIYSLTLMLDRSAWALRVCAPALLSDILLQAWYHSFPLGLSHKKLKA